MRSIAERRRKMKRSAADAITSAGQRVEAALERVTIVMERVPEGSLLIAHLADAEELLKRALNDLEN